MTFRRGQKYRFLEWIEAVLARVQPSFAIDSKRGEKILRHIHSSPYIYMCVSIHILYGNVGGASSSLLLAKGAHLYSIYTILFGRALLIVSPYSGP